MPDERANDEANGIPRRQLISRAAAGAAIVWATPVLSTLRTPAAAAGSPGPPKTSTIPTSCEPPCENNTCGIEPELCVCGESTIEGFPCVFARDIEGECRCFTPICGVGATCEASSECPEGFACVNVECCGQAECAPLCGTEIPAFLRRGAAAANYAWAHV